MTDETSIHGGAPGKWVFYCPFCGLSPEKGVDPTSRALLLYRCLVRHGLVDPQKRRGTREDYEWLGTGAVPWLLWQEVDIMGGGPGKGEGSSRSSPAWTITPRFLCLRLCSFLGQQPAAVCEPARPRAILRRHGVPEQILTDNGKVFTSRFRAGEGRGAL